jgi:hypothetical protein
MWYHPLVTLTLKSNFLQCISLVASVCHNIVDKNVVAEPEMIDYSLRVMVLAIVLYDHVAPEGAFSKTSSINVLNIN